MKFSFTAFLLLISVYSCQAQFEKYSHVYPISEDANVRWISNYSKYETIRFEANPLIKFSFYNNFAKRLPDTTKLHAMAQYIDFGPQFRLYSEKSQPIKTPSYRIFLGTQHMFRLKTKNAKAVQLIGFAFQSGHYSNGQSKCTFAEDENDGGAICNAIYNSITDTTDLSALLNRKNGNYSMNLTEITVNYRFNTLGDSNYAKHAHSVSLGYEINHKGIFGVADVDLVSDADLELIGRHRINVKYEYALNFKLVKKSKISQRIRAKQTLEAIIGAHPHINPIRTETALTFYPLSTVSALGLSFSYIYGHDNYNFRLVDSGSQFTVGLTW
ncbi:MAG: hypothetical protein ACPGD8_04305, partial [Flavobacteriales bacterium]